MTITAEQRSYARLAGILVFLNVALLGVGDGITIISRRSATFDETARVAAESAVLWRAALVQVAVAWIVIGILAFALYVVLEPVNKRLAQLALVMRLGASFLGAAAVMFRIGQARLYQASAVDGLFSTEQLRTLVAVMQRGNGAGFTISMMFLGGGHLLFYLLFLRSRYVPRAVAGLGAVGAVLLIGAAIAMFVVPEWTNELKLLGLPGLFAELAMALWLLIKGLPERAAA